MQISTDFSTRTLVAIAVTALSLTCALTTFVLYKTYTHEIKRLANQFYQSIRHLFIPTYIERPGGVFVPNPRLYPVPERTPTPYHYVADPFREWEGPITFPPLFESQSSRLSSPTNEQDVGQEGGHVIHEEYETIPSIPDTILPEEGVNDLTPRRTLTSFLSSPEFPLRELGIPIVIRSNSETSNEYRPHSPTNSEYERADTPYPSRPTLRRSLTPVPNIRRLAAASRAATAAEELARLTMLDNELTQLTTDNDELERTIIRDRTITEFYERASRPQLEGEPAAQYWQRQTATRAEADAINEVETETYRQRPLHEPVWLERYRQYRSLQLRQGLPGVSLSTWMEARAHAGYHNPRELRTRLYEYLAFQESAYPNRSDLDAFGGGSGMDASGSS
ncbi:hypothetical protein EV421DRAFT_1736826 [Armillaria borealis]|uniref:Transmembrane protein n=1 Tax=Armillaria borealis TaxID=47425 RepID=A0AA39JEY4_9AGAR|nr:hypothetical protein EV421DRAFT_1736826 [Armillaria borealis]